MLSEDSAIEILKLIKIQLQEQRSLKSKHDIIASICHFCKFQQALRKIKYK